MDKSIKQTEQYEYYGLFKDLNIPISKKDSNKQILSVEQDGINETCPATTNLTIKYNDKTIEKIHVCGEAEYSKYRKYIENPYPFHMG